MKSSLDGPAGPLQGILGYLNFSEGRPDPRVQRQWNEAFAALAQQGTEKPWLPLAESLRARLKSLHDEQAAAFRDVDQASSVLDLLFDQVVPAYRAHHGDLLHHVPEADFYQPLFLARLTEAMLAQRGPWSDKERIVQGTLKQVNDFVGHRPIAVLETRPRGEPYAHEQLRPIPLYLKGAGVAFGRFEPLVSRAIEVLRGTDRSLLAEVGFDIELLDELAVDPRSYDFAHPVDKRPNYCFGEWDPHHIDNKGFYRRFVLRQVTLEGLLLRTLDVGVPPLGGSSEPPQGGTPTLPAEELLFEAGAVLAGIILMASGISGYGPGAHDSTVTLSTLMPRVVRVRDAFYARLLQAQKGQRGQRLTQEAKLTRQPFGGARQHINQFFARQRALQIQQRRLALLLADLGYPHAARRQVQGKGEAGLPFSEMIALNGKRTSSFCTPPSVRMVTEIHVHLTTGRMLIEKGALSQARELLPMIEDLLQRGIGCGALVDPWNILGFQAQYPRFTSMEDSVHDTRIEELIRIVDRLLHFYSRLLSEEAATATHDPKAVAAPKLLDSMRHFADWWDRFGSTTVSEVQHVQGSELVESAEHVSQALAHWRQRGEAAELGFWKKHLERFRSPKAFALVIEALLGKEDFRAAMALLMTWLGQSEQVPLSEGEHSFHTLALRWLMGVYAWSGAYKDQEVTTGVVDLVARFFDHLEANAEDYWQVPRVNPLGLDDEQDAVELPSTDDDEESLYGAAYEGVTYKDSTDDNVEEEVLDVMPQKDFDLAEEEPRLQKRLSFLATLAQLWNIACRVLRHARPEDRQRCQVFLRQWLKRARTNFRELLALLDVLHKHEIPKPSGSFESMLEYDKRRSIKENLLTLGLTTCLSQTLAVGVLRGVADVDDDPTDQETLAPSWENTVRTMEKALLRKEPDKVRALVGRFLKEFRKEPLLYTLPQQGGHPRPILRANLAQTILRGLAANLPRQGLLRETWLMLRAAHSMEKHQTLTGPRVTEFDRLFQIGCQASVEAVIESSRVTACGLAPNSMSAPASAKPQAAQIPPERVVAMLEHLLEPLRDVWMKHSKGLRLSMLEAIDTDEEWERMCKFMQRYGKDLFHARFLTLANLRGILHRGVDNYLEYLKNEDSDTGRLLLEELDKQCPRTDALRFLPVIFHTIIENYDFYRDYNATTSQSDYGENLYQLMHFVRLKDRYERLAWQLRPANLVHEVLARRFPAAAQLWRAKAEEQTRPFAEQLLDGLAKVENQFGMRLTTIRDRLQERFVLPLAIDGLCAMIGPAMDQARTVDGEHAIPLEKALEAFTAHPSGVGLDVPVWLARLEAEFHQLQASRTALVSLAETLFQVPKIAVPFEQLESQFGADEPAREE